MIINEKRNLTYLLTSYKALQHNTMLIIHLNASLLAQALKRLSTMQETWVWKIPWRRKWQTTPVLLPGKSHGQRSLVG